MRRWVRNRAAVDWPLVAGIVVSLLTGGGIAALVSSISARKKVGSEIAVNLAGAEKTEAEATEIINRAAGDAVRMLQVEMCRYQKESELMRAELHRNQGENDTMRAELTLLRDGQVKHEREIADLKLICEQFDEVLRGAHALATQVVELNAVPVYKPPERRR